MFVRMLRFLVCVISFFHVLCLMFALKGLLSSSWLLVLSVKCADQNRGHHQFITNAGIISNPQINRQRHMKEDGGFVEIIERLCQRS